MKFNDKNQLRTILNSNISKYFPKVMYSFAYGSAVIPQKENIGKMVDVFLIVENLEEFHTENLKMNNMHYSTFAKSMSLSTLVKINNFGTGVYYNPSIVLENDLLIKYGVVGLSKFKESLLHWNNLFISGRFHKPVLNINTTQEIEKIIELNRKSAVHIIYK